MSDALVGAIWTKNSIKELQETITDLNEENKKLQKVIFRLTIATSILVFVQTIVAIISLLIIFRN